MSSRFHIKENTLLYFHDPMCSWCWGYKNTLGQLKAHLNSNISFQYIVGGLAKDTDDPMPVDMQQRIESTWHQIQKTINDVEFNFDFWKQCKPRRSTYAACRAVITAAKYNKYEQMLQAIQQAYYLQARNPSDYETLYSIAADIGINRDRFIAEIHSDLVERMLTEEINFSHSIGVDSFPSLVFFSDDKFQPVVLDYNNYDISLDHIRSLIA